MAERCHVLFRPSGKSATAVRGQTLLDVARKIGVRISYECDGKCICGTCFVQIESGAENLSEEGREETGHLQRQLCQPGSRLSCQARILGDVTVRVLPGIPT